jgi:predicted dehydrogenase
LGDFTSVWGLAARIGDLEIDVEDTAELILTGPNREIVSVHLDMLQRSGGRTCQIHGTEGSLVWKSSSQSVQRYRARDGGWQEIFSPRAFDGNEMYIDEIQHFFDCVQSRMTPCVGYEDGKRALKVSPSSLRAEVRRVSRARTSAASWAARSSLERSTSPTPAN